MEVGPVFYPHCKCHLCVLNGAICHVQSVYVSNDPCLARVYRVMKLRECERSV